MTQPLQITTPDGLQLVERFGPPGPKAVIVYMDGFGIRDELRAICERYAAMGYTSYLPNMYYRAGGPSFAPPNAVGDRPPAEAQALNKATSVEMSVADTGALIEAEPATHWATIGYCMGGRHALAAAAAFPDQVRACLSLHGGNMIFDGDWSCEKLIPRIRAEIFLGFAKDDPSCPEDHKDLLRAALASPGITGRAQDFDALHGWSFPERHCHSPEASAEVWATAEALLARAFAP